MTRAAVPAAGPAMTGAGLRRLAVGDLGAFWAEKPAAPMHMALGMTLGSGGSPTNRLRVEAIRADLARRCAQLPEFRRRVYWTRWGQGRPFWGIDPRFAVYRHITTSVLPAPGDAAAYLDWCAARALLP